jgi:predicted transcriptional regulator
MMVSVSVLTQYQGRLIMTPQLESLMYQAFQLDSFACASGDRDERLELIAHLANSLQVGDRNGLNLVLTDNQKAQLKQLQAEIDLGLEDIKTGRVLDGETVFANLQQRVNRYRETKNPARLTSCAGLGLKVV